MDAFNRAFVLVAALIAAAVTAILLLVTLDILPPDGVADGWIEDGLRGLDEQGSAGKAALLGVLILIGAGAAALAGVEIATARREVTTEDAEGCRFGISREGIARLVQQVSEETRGVQSLTPRVRGGRRGLRVECLARLEPRYNPVDVAQRLRSLVKRSIEATIGIPVREVTVRVELPRAPARGHRPPGADPRLTT